MGISMSSIGNIFTKQKMHYLMTGIDAAGKTTILYKMNQGKYLISHPSTCFVNFDVIETKDFIMHVYDLNGNDRNRNSFGKYFGDIQGLIFVVDSSDESRIDEVRYELHYLLKMNELRDSILLILANKQDNPNTIQPQKLADLLKLNNITDNQWKIQRTSGISGDGLTEGFEWLYEQVKMKFT